MTKLKRFHHFNESKNEKDQPVKATNLISKDGLVHNKKGWIRDEGIFSENGDRYVAAISEDGKIYSTLSDFNSIVVSMNDQWLPGTQEIHPDNDDAYFYSL